MVNYYLETPKWDSFRIQIPASKVQVLGKIGDILAPVSTLTGQQYTNEDDLIIPMHEVHCKNGIKFRVGKRTVLRGNLPSEDVFEIQLNAKMLGDGYWEGVNKYNLHSIYQYVIDTGIVYVDWDDFLHSKVYDLDCCYDVVCNLEYSQKIVSKLYQSIKYEKKNRITSTHNRIDNTGIELSKRDWQSPTSPNIRIYYKGAEMENKKVSYPNGKITRGEFNDVFHNSLHHSIIRLERNFKNKDTWNYEGLKIEFLEDIFDLDLEQLKKIMLTSVKKYYIDTQVRLRSDLELGPVEYLLSVLIDEKIRDGADISYWNGIIDGFGGGYTQKSRLRNKIKSFTDKPEYKEIIEANNAVGDVWKKLGLE